MSSEELDEPTCECCGCFELAEYTTTCCHIRLCNKHEQELMLETCSNEKCQTILDEYCIQCFDINSISNRCNIEGCKYTWCDDCPKAHKCDI